MPDKFGKEALEAHNRYRSLHQAPQLKWSRSLEKDAESWAKQLAKDGRLRQGDTSDGESIYAVTGKSEVNGGEVVDRWYAEVDNYDFRNPGFKSGTGHFTQIVWQETKELGMAKVKSSDGKIIVVARYRPPGNVINHFQENVNPKLGASKSYSAVERSTRDDTRFGPKRDIFDRDDDRRSSPYRNEAEPRRNFFSRDDDRRSSPNRNETETRREFFRRDDGGRPSRQETTETVTYDRDGGKRTVTRTIITSGDGGGRDPFESFSRDIRSSFDDDPVRDRKDKWEKWGDRKAQPTAYSSSWSSPKPKETKPAERFTPSSSATSSPKGSFSKQSLDTHNKFRSMHGVPPLKWADDLAREAQGWAEKLARARTLQHSSKSERKDAGENIAMFTGKFDSAGEQATTMWYEEVKDYNFRRGGWQGGTGHFTQVVWKGSRELGMGRAKTSDGSLTFVVGRYRPAGNVINYMADNVFPKGSR